MILTAWCLNICLLYTSPPEQMPAWVDVSQTADGIPVNNYFEQHPEMVLGSMVWESGPYGQETGTIPNEA